MNKEERLQYLLDKREHLEKLGRTLNYKTTNEIAQLRAELINGEVLMNKNSQDGKETTRK